MDITKDIYDRYADSVINLYGKGDSKLDRIFDLIYLGDWVSYNLVIINNDYQVKLKGSVPFMSLADRVRIIGALKLVDEVFISIDRDKTVCKSLTKVHPDIFANGGDRHTLNDVPEYSICQKLGISMVDGLGRKIRASSELIKKAAEAKIIAVKK